MENEKIVGDHWRIAMKIHTTDQPAVVVDQPLNLFPVQGLPHEIAVNVGSPDQRQVVKGWSYFEIRIYRRPTVDLKPVDQ